MMPELISDMPQDKEPCCCERDAQHFIIRFHKCNHAILMLVPLIPFRGSGDLHFDRPSGFVPFEDTRDVLGSRLDLNNTQLQRGCDSTLMGASLAILPTVRGEEFARCRTGCPRVELRIHIRLCVARLVPAFRPCASKINPFLAMLDDADNTTPLLVLNIALRIAHVRHLLTLIRALIRRVFALLMIGLLFGCGLFRLRTDEVLNDADICRALRRIPEHPLDLLGIVRVFVIVRANGAENGREIGGTSRVNQEPPGLHGGLKSCRNLSPFFRRDRLIQKPVSMYAVARVHEHGLVQADFLAPPKKCDYCVFLIRISLSVFGFLRTAVDIAPKCFGTIPIERSTGNELAVEHVRGLLVPSAGMVRLNPFGVTLGNVLCCFTKVREAFVFERLPLTSRNEAHAIGRKDRL